MIDYFVVFRIVSYFLLTQITVARVIVKRPKKGIVVVPDPPTVEGSVDWVLTSTVMVSVYAKFPANWHVQLDA